MTQHVDDRPVCDVLAGLPAHPGFQFLDGAFAGLQSLLLSLLQLQRKVSDVLLVVLLDLLQVSAPVLLLPKLLTQSCCLKHITTCLLLSSMSHQPQVM